MQPRAPPPLIPQSIGIPAVAAAWLAGLLVLTAVVSEDGESGRCPVPQASAVTGQTETGGMPWDLPEGD